MIGLGAASLPLGVVPHSTKETPPFPMHYLINDFRNDIDLVMNYRSTFLNPILDENLAIPALSSLPLPGQSSLFSSSSSSSYGKFPLSSIAQGVGDCRWW